MFYIQYCVPDLSFNLLNFYTPSMTTTLEHEIHRSLYILTTLLSGSVDMERGTILYILQRMRDLPYSAVLPESFFVKGSLTVFHSTLTSPTTIQRLANRIR